MAWPPRLKWWRPARTSSAPDAPAVRPRSGCALSARQVSSLQMISSGRAREHPAIRTAPQPSTGGGSTFAASGWDAGDGCISIGARLCPLSSSGTLGTLQTFLSCIICVCAPALEPKGMGERPKRPKPVLLAVCRTGTGFGSRTLEVFSARQGSPNRCPRGFSWITLPACSTLWRSSRGFHGGMHPAL